MFDPAYYSMLEKAIFFINRCDILPGNVVELQRVFKMIVVIDNFEQYISY